MKTVEDKLDQILEQVIELKVDMAETKVTLGRNTESLSEHMRRTSLLEEKLELDFAKVDEELKPIKSHVSLVNAVFLTLCALGSILLALKELQIFSLIK